MKKVRSSSCICPLTSYLKLARSDISARRDTGGGIRASAKTVKEANTNILHVCADAKRSDNVLDLAPDEGLDSQDISDAAHFDDLLAKACIEVLALDAEAAEIGDELPLFADGSCALSRLKDTTHANGTCALDERTGLALPGRNLA